jgi:predicted aspartyl protease
VIVCFTMFLRSLLVLCASFLLIAPGVAQTPSTLPIAPPADVVVAGTDDFYRMTVPVMINGKGPFPFIIDTGADRSVISTQLADRLELPTGRKTRLHAMAGSRDVRTVRVETLQISANTLRNVEAAALPAGSLGAEGLLGIDSLKGLRITMDFGAQTMTAEPSTSKPPQMTKGQAENDGDTIVVTARSRLGQLVMVDADANGEKIWVVVDTGAQNSVANTRLRRMLVKHQRISTLKPITLTDVLGGETKANYAIIQKLRLGGLLMGNAAVAFADVHVFDIFGLKRKPAMLLGMDSMRSFSRVTVDFATRKVTFVMPRRDPFLR